MLWVSSCVLFPAMALLSLEPSASWLLKCWYWGAPSHRSYVRFWVWDNGSILTHLETEQWDKLGECTVKKKKKRVLLWDMSLQTEMTRMPAISLFCLPVLEGRLQRGGVGLLVTTDRMWARSLRLCQGRFRLDVGKDFVTGRVVGHWKVLPGGGRVPVPGSFWDVGFRDGVWWWDPVGQLGGWTRWPWRSFPTYDYLLKIRDLSLTCLFVTRQGWIAAVK